RVLEDAVSRFPRNRAIHSIRAMSLYRLGDYTEATQEWGELCEVEPKNLKYVTTYAYSLLMLGHLEDALPHIERAKRIDGSSYRTIILDAELSFRNGEIDRARTLFQKALELSSDSLEAIGRLAVIECQRGNEAQCDKYLELAQNLVEKEPSSWQRLCDSYRLMDKEDLLLDCLTFATKQDQGCAAAWIRLANEYMQKGLVERAHQAWRESFEIRGYVKLHCSDCDTYFKVPYNEHASFDPFEHAECIYCNSHLPMPDSLAVI
ncbi:tetratricopeptide repeat protein, partial [Candidatus Thorarchaeota archaeon]